MPLCGLRRSHESKDTDHDGVGDNKDADDDGDGVIDGKDAFPENVRPPAAVSCKS